MTAQEQAFDVAHRYICGSSREREIILSCFQGEQREVFLRGVGIIHLFSDQALYDATMKAIRDRMMKELYKNGMDCNAE